MKYLVVLLVVLVGVWAWRNNRRIEQADKAASRPAARPPEPALQDMVRCAVCGVHLPQADAVSGRHGGVYCSTAHRQQAEG
jgi:uncharacterized protein